MSRILSRAKTRAGFIRVFRRSPTVICISVTPNRSVSISAWRRSLAASAICDSTIPIRARKNVEYVDSIKEDVRWLGFDWDGEYYASDYFEQLYQLRDSTDQGRQSVRLRSQRGADAPISRHADRAGQNTARIAIAPADENLDLFQRMRAGEFADGSRTLRAKIDMASPNINLRDPVMYRVLRATHHRTGDQWCIYPTYDFAHGQSDSIEGITHSICTLEFEDHRPLYDWFLGSIGDSSSAADRIRSAQSNLYGIEQAQTAATGPAKTCGWLGRSAHADAGRHTAARLHAGSDSQVLRTHRRGQRQQHRRYRHAGTMPARRFEQARAARDGGATADQSRLGKLSRRAGRRAGGDQQSGGPQCQARARCRFRASYTSSRTIFAKNRPKDFFGSRPAKKCGCVTLTSSSAPKL